MCGGSWGRGLASVAAQGVWRERAPCAERATLTEPALSLLPREFCRGQHQIGQSATLRPAGLRLSPTRFRRWQGDMVKSRAGELRDSDVRELDQEWSLRHGGGARTQSRGGRGTCNACGATRRRAVWDGCGTGMHNDHLYPKTGIRCLPMGTRLNGSFET
jgi:hypothetical protein